MCCDSAALPPLPQINTLPPSAKQRPSIMAARAMSRGRLWRERCRVATASSKARSMWSMGVDIHGRRRVMGDYLMREYLMGDDLLALSRVEGDA